MYWINVILTGLVVIFTGSVAIFTGLYWWDTKRAFLLELDRVALWFRLQVRKEELTEEQINEVIRKALEEFNVMPEKKKELLSSMKEEFEISQIADRFSGDFAFFQTLESKSLRQRLEGYEKKQMDIAHEMKEVLRKTLAERRRRKSGRSA